MIRYLAVIPHASGVVVTEDGALPSVVADGIPAAVEALRAAHVTADFLRPSTRLTVGNDVTMMLEFDASDAALPTLPIDHVARQLSEPLRSRLSAWLDERRTGTLPDLRPRWARSGWSSTFTDWIAASVRAAGAEPIGEPRVIQQWAISAVWAHDSTDGTFYGKAVFGAPAKPGSHTTTGFWHEPALTNLLWTEHGSLIPEPVAIDTERGLMLMRDMRANPLNTGTANAEPALAALAHIQRHWISRTDELLAVGCQDRRPSTVLDRAIELVSDRTGVDDDQAAQFTSSLPVLRWMSHQLEHGPIPVTLTHGDLHDGNVAIGDDQRVVLFDWSDGAIAHPFIDLDVFVRRRPPTDHDTLIDAYLAEWSDTADRHVLLELLEFAQLFSRLNQAITSFDLCAQLEPDDRAPFQRGLTGSWELFFDAWRTWRVRADRQ